MKKKIQKFLAYCADVIIAAILFYSFIGACVAFNLLFNN